MESSKEILDPKRISEIERLALHRPQVNKILDDYVKRAAQEFDLPIGLVSIVLDESQHFAASHGLTGWLETVNGTPVEWSFCANSVENKKPFIVEDATTHERVKDNPLVTIDGIKCYAGVPLITKNDFVVGNFCVIGDQSRSFSEEEIKKLKGYATQVMDKIEDAAVN